ncbi:hypothetical protein FRC03_005829 [Tulasnella sp. 419]|nr:hypothetical protein FRC03_005829 [Tulasnella sp. 419]
MASYSPHPHPQHYYSTPSGSGSHHHHNHHQSTGPHNVRRYSNRTTPSHYSAFSAELSAYLVDFCVQLLPTQEEMAVKEDVRKLLEKLIRTIQPSSTLRAFGSTANGFSLKNSDMDLCCLIDSGVSNPPSASELVTILGELFERETKFHVKPLPHARIPIIKLSLSPSEDLPYGLACDIGFENRLALENTRLLMTYAMIDPTRVQTMVLFLKVWSKRRKINSPYRGTLSSYGFVLLVLYFLIHIKKPAVLPNLQSMSPTTPGASKEKFINGANVWFFDDVEYLRTKWMSSNIDSVAELLIDFFRFYARDFPFTLGVSSIRAGSLKKEEKGWSMQDDGESTSAVGGSRDRNWLCIEDPFETGYNVGRTATKEGLELIRSEFARASKILSSRPERALLVIPQLLEEREELNVPLGLGGTDTLGGAQIYAQTPYFGAGFASPNPAVTMTGYPYGVPHVGAYGTYFGNAVSTPRSGHAVAMSGSTSSHGGSPTEVSMMAPSPSTSSVPQVQQQSGMSGLGLELPTGDDGVTACPTQPSISTSSISPVRPPMHKRTSSKKSVHMRNASTATAMTEEEVFDGFAFGAGDGDVDVYLAMGSDTDEEDGDGYGDEDSMISWREEDEIRSRQQDEARRREEELRNQEFGKEDVRVQVQVVGEASPPPYSSDPVHLTDSNSPSANGSPSRQAAPPEVLSFPGRPVKSYTPPETTPSSSVGDRRQQRPSVRTTDMPLSISPSQFPQQYQAYYGYPYGYGYTYGYVVAEQSPTYRSLNQQQPQGEDGTWKKSDRLTVVGGGGSHSPSNRSPRSALRETLSPDGGRGQMIPGSSPNTPSARAGTLPSGSPIPGSSAVIWSSSPNSGGLTSSPRSYHESLPVGSSHTRNGTSPRSRPMAPVSPSVSTPTSPSRSQSHPAQFSDQHQKSQQQQQQQHRPQIRSFSTSASSTSTSVSPSSQQQYHHQYHQHQHYHHQYPSYSPPRFAAMESNGANLVGQYLQYQQFNQHQPMLSPRHLQQQFNNGFFQQQQIMAAALASAARSPGGGGPQNQFPLYQTQGYGSGQRSPAGGPKRRFRSESQPHSAGGGGGHPRNRSGSEASPSPMRRNMDLPPPSYHHTQQGQMTPVGGTSPKNGGYAGASPFGSPKIYGKSPKLSNGTLTPNKESRGNPRMSPNVGDSMTLKPCQPSRRNNHTSVSVELPAMPPRVHLPKSPNLGSAEKVSDSQHQSQDGQIQPSVKEVAMLMEMMRTPSGVSEDRNGETSLNDDQSPPVLRSPVICL